MACTSPGPVFTMEVVRRSSSRVVLQCRPVDVDVVRHSNLLIVADEHSHQRKFILLRVLALLSCLALFGRLISQRLKDVCSRATSFHCVHMQAFILLNNFLNLFWFRGGSEEAKERDRVLVECVVPELDVENFEEELHGEEVDDEDTGAAEVDAADGNGKQQRLKETLTVGGKGEALSLHGRDCLPPPSAHNEGAITEGTKEAAQREDVAHSAATETAMTTQDDNVAVFATLSGCRS
ncbi:hypothetical protein TYRP_004871 [Tyrophagus putrescentiae]|nr:hypothetical protein TYRP_004871 [Tyrophagus putrescentiae]